jgi:opacity protein-like surface antigen
MLRKSLLAAAIFALSATAANAASRVWISEFAVLTATASGGSAGQMAALPSLTDQATLDISGGVQTSAAFGSQTKYFRIICEVQCAVKVGGTATTSSTLIPALSPEYFGVQPGATVSVIAAP